MNTSLELYIKLIVLLERGNMAKRSYFEEINDLSDTWDTISNEPIVISERLSLEDIKGKVFCIGSGGSLVLAKLWEYLHEDFSLGLAKTITPYEYITDSQKSDLVVIFSASGKNHDILQVFKTAIQRESKVLVFTITPESALIRLVKSNPLQACAVYPISRISKDGFLAVNSTIGIIGLMKNFFNLFLGACYPSLSPVKLGNEHHLKYPINNDFSSHISTVQIIASDYGMPAGLDLMVRFAESGLVSCFLTDPRNFGHGRFIWLDKHPKNTKVVFINTTKSHQFMKRLEKTLPKNIQCYKINSPYDGLLGAAYCITRTILLFGDLSQKYRVDPGKPVVPDWGRKLHSLRLNTKDINKTQEYISSNKYPALTTQFNGIVLDLDGTLINTDNRFGVIEKKISKELNRLLDLGLKLGISTGRGDSALDLLRKCILSRFWDNVIVGLYNGTLLLKLSDNFNQQSDEIWPLNKILHSKLESICYDLKNNISVRPTQITLHGFTSAQQETIKKEIVSFLGQKIQFVKILTTSHSMDFIPQWGTKLIVVEALVNNANDVILCIGDQGQIGGNDEELLRWKPAISVGKKRPASNDCFWLGRQKNLQEANGTMVLLSAIEAKKGLFVINSAKISNGS
jgi:HAD superfamily hydrolase (TIGR01484 family)